MNANGWNHAFFASIFHPPARLRLILSAGPPHCFCFLAFCGPPPPTPPHPLPPTTPPPPSPRFPEPRLKLAAIYPAPKLLSTLEAPTLSSGSLLAVFLPRPLAFCCRHAPTLPTCLPYHPYPLPLSSRGGRRSVKRPNQTQGLPCKDPWGL